MNIVIEPSGGVAVGLSELEQARLEALGEEQYTAVSGLGLALIDELEHVCFIGARHTMASAVTGPALSLAACSLLGCARVMSGDKLGEYVLNAVVESIRRRLSFCSSTGFRVSDDAAEVLSKYRVGTNDGC